MAHEAEAANKCAGLRGATRALFNNGQDGTGSGS